MTYEEKLDKIKEALNDLSILPVQSPGRLSFALFGEPWPLSPVEGAGGYSSGAGAGVSPEIPDKNKKHFLQENT